MRLRNSYLRIGNTRSVAVGLSVPMRSEGEAARELVGGGEDPASLGGMSVANGHGFSCGSGEATAKSLAATGPSSGSPGRPC